MEGCRFVLIKLFGAIDDKSLSDIITSHAKKTQGIPDMKELIDCRDVTNLDELTVHGVRNTANHLGNKPEWLLALLINDNPMLQGMAEGYRVSTVEQRKDVKVFTELKEAISWIAQDKDELSSINTFINEGAESLKL